MAENAQEAPKVTGRPVPWFDGARELIAKAEPGGDDVLDWIEAQIKANNLTLFEVRDEWQTIGMFTARWAQQYDGTRNLQIIHGISLVEEDGFSFLVAAENLVKDIARGCGCSRVEIHSRRRGLDRRLTQQGGYVFQEAIYSIGV